MAALCAVQTLPALYCSRRSPWGAEARVPFNARGCGWYTAVRATPLSARGEGCGAQCAELCSASLPCPQSPAARCSRRGAGRTLQGPPSLITALLQPNKSRRAPLQPCCGDGCSCTWPAPWRCGPPAAWPHAVTRSDFGRWTAGSSASQVGPATAARSPLHPAGGHAPRDSKQLHECMRRTTQSRRQSILRWQPACRLNQAAL